MLPFFIHKTRITIFPYLASQAFLWVFSYWVSSIFWNSSTESILRETKDFAPRGNRAAAGAASAPGIRHLHGDGSRLRQTISPRVVPVSAGPTATQGCGRARDTLQHHKGGKVAPS